MSNPEFRQRLRPIAVHRFRVLKQDTLTIAKACNTTEDEVIRAIDSARGFVYYERAPTVSALRSSARRL